MSGLAFINYRRDDTSQIAQALYMQLKEVFGAGQLFMDVNSIRVSEPWPERIQHKLDRATVVLALMGPGWLTVKNKDGTLRIDDESDWVRNELLRARQRGIPIIPIAINHIDNLPDTTGLPELCGLKFTEAKVLHLDPAEWRADLLVLSRELQNFGLREERVLSEPGSVKKGKTPPLTEQALERELKKLGEWEEWVEALALEYPLERHELRRTFIFDTFMDVMDFMNEVATLCDRAQHHPRWSNENRHLKIRFTTWDAGNKITQYDVKAAHMIDAAYAAFKARKKNATSGSIE